MFAPSEYAFSSSKINPNELRGLMRSVPRLTDVILRHVVPGSLYTSGIDFIQEKQTANNQIVSLSLYTDLP